MINKKLSALLIGALFLGGCVVSLNPLFTPKDLVYDPALIGAWTESGKEVVTWAFEKAEASSYKLVVTEGDKSSPFVAHLVQLGHRRFLDISPDASALDALKPSDLYKMALIRGHLFLKVIQIEPTLRMGMLNRDWLDKWLKDDPQALPHQIVKDESALNGEQLVLTASTQELQRFVTTHWDTKDAWGDKTSDMKRRP